MESLFQRWVSAGGPLMWVLVPCSLLMLASTIQGMILLRRKRVTPRWLLERAKETTGDKRRRFIADLRNVPIPLARVLWLALKDFEIDTGRPERSILEEHVEEASAKVADDLLDCVNLSATLYTVAPLIGLLGTILGLADSFYRFGVLEEMRLQSLSVGMQEAMITTVWGLFTAIGAFVAAQWMQSKIRTYERRRFPAAVADFVDVLYGPSSEQLEKLDDKMPQKPTAKRTELALFSIASLEQQIDDGGSTTPPLPPDRNTLTKDLSL